MRTYKKTYVRKKTGEIVTKTYTTRKRDQSEILVGKKGDDHQKRIENYLNQFKDNPTAYAARKNIIRRLTRDRQINEEITTRTVESALARDSRDKFLINAGYTAEEAAEELGATLEEFYNAANWSTDSKGRIGSRFTNSAGVTFQLTFNYTGSVWKKL